MKWFFSDPHFGHQNVLAFCNRRLFMSDDELKMLDADEPVRGPNKTWKPSPASRDRMDTYFIDKINEYVRPQDDLWCLGDFGFGTKDQLRDYRNRINCQNFFMIWGNHDRKYARKMPCLFTKSYDLKCVKWEGYRFECCHYAMCVWNQHRRGSIHLYGHSHSNSEDNLDRLFPGRRSMDVGLDNLYRVLGDYRPISAREIVDIMANRIGHSLDHH